MTDGTPPCQFLKATREPRAQIIWRRSEGHRERQQVLRCMSQKLALFRPRAMSIRIASIQQPPERVVIDTSQPTIVPPPTLVGDAVPGELSPLQSYGSAAPPPTVIDVDQQKRRVIKRPGAKVAAAQPP